MGTPGHMKHPFDVSRVETGQDLINYFIDIKEFLELNPGSLKIDGINVSFKLITIEGGKKEFRMDRGTTHTESVVGMNAEDAYKKWPEGHGMPPAIKTLLDIFNKALPSIKYELHDLGMWDNSTKFFNTEYVAGKTNVQKYNKNFLAIHGINQFYEKKGPKKWVETGKSMDRPGKERPTDPKTGKPVKAASVEIPYNRGALESLIKKVKPFASQHGFEIYGDVPTEIATEIDFEQTLGSPLTIQMTGEDQETHSLEEWLSNAQNPGRTKITKSDGKQVDAISKDIYMAVLNEIPLMEYLQSPEDVKKAISGAVFNHATRMLGNDVKAALDSSMGSVADHEGVVLRGMEEFPVKVTGEFIVGGMQTAFREGTVRRANKILLSEASIIKVDAGLSKTPRGAAPQLMVIHHTMTSSPQKTLNSWPPRGTRIASTHYEIDTDGTIYEYLDPAKWTAWHSGSKTSRDASGINGLSIGIDLTGNFREIPEESSSQIRSLVSLVNTLSSRFGIPLKVYTGKKKMTGAAAIAQGYGITLHRTHANTGCPGKLADLLPHLFGGGVPSEEITDVVVGAPPTSRPPSTSRRRKRKGNEKTSGQRLREPAGMAMPKGKFVHGINPIEKFKFDVFYNELVVYFGAKAIEEMLPIHGKDYKFGREHQKAYDDLQRAKGASTTTEPLVNPSGLLITPEIERAPTPLKEAKDLKGIKDVEEELGIETVNLDEPEAKRKIALIPGGFKPPHMGHLALITHYLDEVAPNGKVVIFMGSGGDTPRTIHGNPITFEDALKIWKIYLSNEHIAFPNEFLDIKKVEGGPIGHVVDYVKEADPEKEIIYLGAGAKDAKRWKFMLNNPKYNPNNVKIFIEPIPNYKDNEGRPMSATNFRDAIESGDEELIKSYIPENSQSSYREIIDTLTGQLKEAQQPLGIFLRLIEETINEERVVTVDKPWKAEQAVDLPSGAKIVGRGGAPDKWFQSFFKLKKQFIDLNIRQRSTQILDVANRKLTKKERFDIMSKIEKFIQKTRIKFYTGDGPGKDPDYGGPAFYKRKTNMIGIEQFPTYWHPKGINHARWVEMIYHELGHAKEEAIDRVFRPFEINDPFGRPDTGAIQVGSTSRYYSERIFNRTRVCFPGLKMPGQGTTGHGFRKGRRHSERPTEHFASLSALRQILGRSVEQIDLEMVCAKLAGASLSGHDFNRWAVSLPLLQSWMRGKEFQRRWSQGTQRRQAPPPDPMAALLAGGGALFLEDFLSSAEINRVDDIWEKLINTEVWKTFSCKKCGPNTNLGVETIDSIARLDTKDIKGPTKRRSDPRLAAPAAHPIAESFLNIIEETLDEAMAREMYGGFIENFPEIAYPEQNSDDEEEATTAEDIVKAMMDALLNIAEEHNIDIEDEEELEEISAAGSAAGGGTGSVEGSPGSKKKKSKESEETLIREIEDYLFSMLGVSP